MPRPRRRLIRYTVHWNPGIREFLERIGAHADVIVFIESLPDSKTQGKLANEVRKKPAITLAEISAKAGAIPQRRELNEAELGMIIALQQRVRGDDGEWTLTPFGEWMGIQLMKYRHKPQTPQKFFRWVNEDGTAEDLLDAEETEHLFLQLRDWANAVRPRLASYSMAQASTASMEWHKAVAGLGKGMVYDNTGEIVYTFENDWTIRTVTSRNDLKVEGSAMQHCVASYAGKVEGGASRIFSLRDTNNMPHATVELEGKKDVVLQIQGKQDKVPVEKYRDLLSEWLRDIGAYKVLEGGYNENTITFKIWESYDLKDAAYAIGDYYGQEDVEPYGTDELYGIPLVEKVEWNEPEDVLEAIIDKYDQAAKSLRDPHQQQHRAWHARKLEDLNDEFVKNTVSSLIHQCEAGELHEAPESSAIRHRKQQLFDRAADMYYGLYRVESAGVKGEAKVDYSDDDYMDRYFEEVHGHSATAPEYGVITDEYLDWAGAYVRANPIMMLCRAIIEKLGLPVFPLTAQPKDTPGQQLFEFATNPRKKRT